MTTTINLDALGQQLQLRLSRLLQRVDAMEDDLRALPDDDSAERATEGENGPVLERLDDLARAEVQQIRRALNRIEDGTYGRCVRCGSAIDPARLRAALTALTCVGCASGAK